MLRRDYTDIVCGLVMFAGGLAFSLYAAANYPLGTLAQMGSGMFPTGLGILFAMFGIAVAVPALRRQGTLPEFKLRPALVVVVSVILFAAIVPMFGLVPAVVVLVLASTLAEPGGSLLFRIVLAAVLALAAVLIFTVGLRLPMATFRWPF